MQAVVDLDTSDEDCPKSPDCLPEFVLQVAERSEYLNAAARLMDYEYVHECYKYDRDVVFVVVKRERMQKPYLRTVRARASAHLNQRVKILKSGKLQ